jgi:hypothetical protein
VSGLEPTGPLAAWGPGTALAAGDGPGAELPGAPGLPGPSEAPVEIAQRYRELVAELDETRLRAIGDRAARARAHRLAAARIRGRVQEVWKAIAEPLARYGYTDLDDLRAEDPEPGRAIVVLDKTGGRREPGDRRAGRAGDRRVRDTREGDLDPGAAPGLAHELCMRAMAQAAELRALSGSGGLPSLLVTALASVLVGGAVAAARVVTAVPGLGCLAAAALAVAFAVAVVSRGGYRAALRAALLGAGAAGIAVLATARAHSPDPSGVAGAVVVIALAFRFGLGLGGRRART